MANSKTQKSAEMFKFPTFDMGQVSESYREYADRAMTQSRESYAKIKQASESATQTVESTLENAQAGTVELSLKAIDGVRQGTENALSHVEALLGVRSIAEMIELQSTFMRKQSELMVDQTKIMQEAVRKVAGDVSKPAKDATEKVMANVETEAKAAKAG
ncbi:phasin family protein [Pseudohoeflea coraliihabitans]|uniref:Phasin family protein n=1 Tax=Pseudohoeflea coraliihabitans TaxID=2860393 RepID=A0ABS6WQJ8_9HYPH|nr:phasin family protein [Pseudohoeflea sp. DP4N28-3]MBW3097319.1 phasin family protein [Pseudohoeflea sp. DP4N28-3]